MNCPYNVKICTKCKKILIACEINFVKAKKGKYGLASKCKECNKIYREEHKEENKEYMKKYYEEHKEERKELDKIYREEHKEEITEYQKKYREEHKEEIAEYKKEYYSKEENKEKASEYQKKYREEHKEEIAEYKKEHCKNNPYIYFNSRNKRRSKEENQGNGISKDQWLEMMNYFNWCCAYSGEYLGGKENQNIRSIDHIIALDNEGLNEIWNCVPMIKSYNISKLNRNMEDWYIKQFYFNEERLEKIYAWCDYAYNKWYK